MINLSARLPKHFAPSQGSNSIWKQSRELLASAMLVVLLTYPPSLAASDGEHESRSQEAKPYAECQQLLDSPPLSELRKYAAGGRGAMIGERDFGNLLIGVNCTEAQIFEYMERHGFVHRQTRRWQETEYSLGFGGYDYNKTLMFSTRVRNWLSRLIHGKYDVGVRLVMLDDTIVHIFAGAHK